MTLWKTMEKFSSYAHMAYQAAYLKAHHRAPYLAAMLNAGGGYYGIGESGPVLQNIAGRPPEEGQSDRAGKAVRSRIEGESR